jgi:hypothetical protein
LRIAQAIQGIINQHVRWRLAFLSLEVLKIATELSMSPFSVNFLFLKILAETEWIWVPMMEVLVKNTMVGLARLGCSVGHSKTLFCA